MESLSRSRFGRHRGFSLVVTVMMMVLLSLLAVGLLSLATIRLRAGGQGLAMTEARANARLALVVALGELQKQAGPDRRITANSAIFDSTPDTPEVDGLRTSGQILGVWDSWSSWLNGEMELEDGSRLAIGDTYKKGRDERLFRRWLISHPEPDVLSEIDAPSRGGFGFDGENSVLLVGEGTLGASPPTEERVRAGLIEAGGTGALAWWVGAENQKASIANPAVERRSIEQIRTGIGSLSHADARPLEGLEALAPGEVSARRYVSLPTAEVAVVAAGGSASPLRKRFHALTAFSRSLPIDVRDGRLKTDLNLLFENDELPEGYRIESDHEPAVRPTSRDLAGYSPKLPQRTLFSWGRMHAFYRMYRPQPNPIPNPTLAGIFEPSVQYDGSAAFVSMFLNKNKRHAVGSYNDAAYARMPVILKHYANIGLQTERVSSSPERFEYYITFSPVTVLWNPYNIRLRLPNDFLGQTTLFYKNLEMEYRVWLNGQPMSNWVEFDYRSPNSNENRLGGDLQTHFTSNGTSTGPPIIFEPGEMLFFSHSEDSAEKYKNAKFQLGYQPQNFDKRRLKVPGMENLTGRPRVGISLRFSNAVSHNANHAGSNSGSFAVRYTTVKGTRGLLQVVEGSGEVTDADAHMPSWFGIDWFLPDQANQEIIADDPQNAAPFQYGDSEPYAIASVGITAKTAAQPSYPGHVGWVGDWRCKNWLNASPAFFGTQLLNPTDRNRAQCPYFLHFTELDGGVDLSAVTPHSGVNAILGSGVAGAEQISFAPVMEIPTRPITSLAGFAGCRLLPGWWDESPLSRESPVRSDLTWMVKRLSYHSGVPGVGIGNSFAHPMLEPDDIYTYHDVSRVDNRNYSEAFSDYWDHLLLANDALWDGHFLSSVATPVDGSRPPEERLEAFFKQGDPLDDVRLEPWLGGEDPDVVIEEVLGDGGWDRLAGYLMINGGFNVNSTSVDAWKALFFGLLGRPFVYQEEDGSIGTITPDEDEAVLSRFHLPTTRQECKDPRNGAFDGTTGLSRWSGVRYLDRDQLARLAEECVRQVKLRGPFLNMSDFVNRRLSDDELGVRGALQAAIDYDDDSPEPGSINHAFKSREDMIRDSDVSGLGYAFPEAATGSRFTGIPGYVVQSDLLQALGNSLTVRDDTFRIRGYGESRDRSGKVLARAWCEAIVQRGPAYVDPADERDVPSVVRDENGDETNAGGTLAATNLRFGRRFEIVGFRWLSPEEI
ncbi:hypothetical protein [Haloferula sp. A504]|uniref:hypothetical protein n=1 Tax=Haloferula sp. A504 TaxID=3373601 RepID=UPI0031BD50DA|nr:hypothetical protein [Verrucomicrobiaceae bacterium E54]